MVRAFAEDEGGESTQALVDLGITDKRLPKLVMFLKCLARRCEAAMKESKVIPRMARKRKAEVKSRPAKKERVSQKRSPKPTVVQTSRRSREKAKKKVEDDGMNDDDEEDEDITDDEDSDDVADDEDYNEEEEKEEDSGDNDDDEEEEDSSDNDEEEEDSGDKDESEENPLAYYTGPLPHKFTLREFRRWIASEVRERHLDEHNVQNIDFPWDPLSGLKISDRLLLSEKPVNALLGKKTAFKFEKDFLYCLYVKHERSVNLVLVEAPPKGTTFSVVRNADVYTIHKFRNMVKSGKFCVQTLPLSR